MKNILMQLKNILINVTLNIKNFLVMIIVTIIYVIVIIIGLSFNLILTIIAVLIFLTNNIKVFTENEKVKLNAKIDRLKNFTYNLEEEHTSLINKLKSRLSQDCFSKRFITRILATLNRIRSN